MLKNFFGKISELGKKADSWLESKVPDLQRSTVSRGRKACKADCKGCGNCEALVKSYEERMLAGFAPLELKPGNLVLTNRHYHFTFEEHYFPLNLRYNPLEMNEDIFIPVRGPTKVASVKVTGGAVPPTVTMTMKKSKVPGSYTISTGDRVPAGSVLMFLGIKDYPLRDSFLSQKCARWLWGDKIITGWMDPDDFDIVKRGES